MDIKINGKKYKANKGDTIYSVCKRNGINVPTLCSTQRFHDESVCRICVVEINLSGKLVPSCSFPVCEKLEVMTETEKVLKARRINMELLWADHAGKCVACKKNRRCHLQKIAEDNKIENFHFIPRKGEITDSEELDLLKDNKSRVVVEDKNGVISRNSELCVECRRCIRNCELDIFGFNKRSSDVVVGTPYEEVLDCIFCGQCVKDCPTGALVDHNDLGLIRDKLDDLKKLAVALVDPAVFQSIRNEFPDVDISAKLVGLLRNLGFEKVFDLSWGMKRVCQEMASEKDIRKGLSIISACPAFNLLVKKHYPEAEKYLLKAKTPDEIMAQVIKTDYARKEKINPDDIVVISISPCTAKKVLAGKDLNHVLTVRELGRLAREKKLDESGVENSHFDKLDGGTIRGFDKLAWLGGTAEAVRSLVQKRDMDILMANGTREARKFLDNIKKGKVKADLAEVMICPEGCVGGGGQAKDNF